MRDIKQKPNNKTNRSNWIIIPKVDLREIAKDGTSIKSLVVILEEAGDRNPSLLDFILLPDGKCYNETLHAIAHSVDDDMSFTAYQHILTHPGNTHASNIDPDEILERVLNVVRPIIASKVNMRAKEHVNLSMAGFKHISPETAWNEEITEPDLVENPYDAESNWVVIERSRLREIARQATGIRHFVETIEAAGEVNPDVCNFILVRDGIGYTEGAQALVSEIMLDGTMLKAVEHYALEHPGSKHLSDEQLSDLQTEAFERLQSDISELANAYAICHAEQAMTEIKPAK